MEGMNTQLVLVSGLSSTGKTASLRNIRDQDKWYYLNTESNKPVPFKNNFRNFKISDPLQVIEAFNHAADNDPDCKGIIVDSLTFLMDMFESQYVLTSSNTMKAWGDYNQFFKTIMQQCVIKFNKPTIFLAHVQDSYDEATLDTKTSVPIKGALKGQGIEAYFSTVVSTKAIALKELEPFKSDLLHITEDDEDLGMKYVFQTRKTKKTLGERIRSPMGLFSKDQTFIDNDCQLLLDHLDGFYKGN